MVQKALCHGLDDCLPLHRRDEGCRQEPEAGQEEGRSQGAHRDEGFVWSAGVRHRDPAAKHDSTELKKVKLPSESFLAIDRAYIDYKLFESFSKKKTTYVTRMKKNLKYDHVSDNPVSDNILRDENVQFHFVSRKKERVHRARIVEHYVEETGKTWRLLTNNNELPAKEIVEIYRRRWQIETFYRSLKQNFRFISFTETARMRSGYRSG
ncbi:transposase [Fibrobacter sp. UWS1]|uniref:transposase n=1 Tax=Fibrobacter sp. UWS1 TaxID=1896220 RepID=UPI0013044A15|nr:transposase [Fibrobacter sp. UWS1]